MLQHEKSFVLQSLESDFVLVHLSQQLDEVPLQLWLHMLHGRGQQLLHQTVESDGEIDDVYPIADGRQKGRVGQGRQQVESEVFIHFDFAVAQLHDVLAAAVDHVLQQNRVQRRIQRTVAAQQQDLN